MRHTSSPELIGWKPWASGWAARRVDRLPKVRSQIGIGFGLDSCSLRSVAFENRPESALPALLPVRRSDRSWSPLHSLVAPWHHKFRLGRFTNGLLANSLANRTGRLANGRRRRKRLSHAPPGSRKCHVRQNDRRHCQSGIRDCPEGRSRRCETPTPRHPVGRESREPSPVGGTEECLHGMERRRLIQPRSRRNPHFPADLFAMAGNLRVRSDRWKKILFARRT